MLTDSHLKVLYYEPSSSEIFINTNIKGGIAITLHNTFKDYGAIITFAREPIMNNILHKVFSKTHQKLFQKHLFLLHIHYLCSIFLLMWDFLYAFYL